MTFFVRLPESSRIINLEGLREIKIIDELDGLCLKWHEYTLMLSGGDRTAVLNAIAREQPAQFPDFPFDQSDDHPF
ncbi:hypothetical protein DO97_07990 [Neosynechococcus sphagnicola sy1]|uniref:Uncharacterized protein n=1 Tax=Neosynechococcus sphagnicola sy1 TaxID=1497020 RepID=A0A098TIV8_9CYAN|nr:hypothetical protein [Neosynechococcus sphagnicola]KGF72490.1 hypothetical protein DO97_07990 [Neosynechococcus sphagnicola sy1]